MDYNFILGTELIIELMKYIDIIIYLNSTMMVNPNIAHLKSMILLARQSKEDLRLISDDGREVFGHKIVVSIFSKFMTDLFLCQDKDETMITLTWRAFLK